MLDLISIFQSPLTAHSVKLILRETNKSLKEKQRLNKHIIQNLKFSSLLLKNDILEIQSIIYVILKICFKKTLKMKKLLPPEILDIDLRSYNYAVKEPLYNIFKNHAHEIHAYKFSSIYFSEKKITAKNENFYIFSNKTLIKFFFKNEIISVKKNLITDVKIEESAVEIFTEKSKITVFLEENLKLLHDLKNEKSTAVFYEDLNDKTGISTKFMSKYSQGSFHSKDNSFIKKMNFNNSVEDIGTPISGKTDDNIFQRNTPVMQSEQSSAKNFFARSESVSEKGVSDKSNRSNAALHMTSGSSTDTDKLSSSHNIIKLSSNHSMDKLASSHSIASSTDNIASSTDNISKPASSTDKLASSTNISKPASSTDKLVSSTNISKPASSMSAKRLGTKNSDNKNYARIFKNINRQITDELEMINKLSAHLTKKSKRKYALLKNHISKYLKY